MATGAGVLLPALGFPPSVPPFSGDSLDALNRATQDASAFFTQGTRFFVYRPLTYASFWAQNEAFGLNLSVFFSINLAIWLGCALVMYGLVRIHVSSSLVALVAAVALLTDHRVSDALVRIIERQSVLACLLGGAALAIAYRLPARGRARGLGAGAVFLLLTACLLSKEYGAAFVAATLAVAVLGRPELRAPLFAAGAAAVGVYASMRWLVPVLSGAPKSEGVLPNYCESMGLFFEEREVCYGQLDFSERLVQHAWNVGATLVGTAYPYLFDGHGTLVSPDLSRPVLSLVYPTVVLGLAATAWVKRPRVSLPLLVLVLANAGLNYVLFRHRNHLIGAIGLYGSAAIGLQPALALVAERLQRISAATPSVAAVLAAVLVAWGIGNEARNLQSSIDQERAQYASAPCVYLRFPNLAPEVSRKLETMQATARCRR